MAYNLVYVARIDEKGRIQLGRNANDILGLKLNDRVAVLLQGKTIKIVRFEDVLKKGITFKKSIKKRTSFMRR